jgi:cell division control protein 12
MTQTRPKLSQGYDPRVVGVANLPNQRHRALARRGATFTLMVVGKW